MRNVIVDGLAFYQLEDGSLFPVLRGAKGGAPGPAAPTAEEKRLQTIQADSASEQLKLARAQQAENEALMPLLLQEYGINRISDISQADPRVATLQAERAQLAAQDAARPQGAAPLTQGGRGGPAPRVGASLAPNPRIAAIDAELRGLDPGGRETFRYEKNEDDLTTKRKEIEGMQLDRSLKALKGELPVTATLAKELELGKRTLAEKLNRQLGPGWETSSAGIQANAEYDRMATSLREAEQKDQLTTAEALSINRQSSRAGNAEGLINVSGSPRAGAAGLLRGAGSGAGDALSYYGSLRNASERARGLQADNTAGYVSAGVGAVGAGAALYGSLTLAAAI